MITSCADKTVTLYETATGNAICRTTCGEVTTSMCLSTNLRHLITTSMDGIIYIWRLPETLTKALAKLRAEPPQKPKPLVQLKQLVMDPLANPLHEESKELDDQPEFNFNAPS